MVRWRLSGRSTDDCAGGVLAVRKRAAAPGTSVVVVPLGSVSTARYGLAVGTRGEATMILAASQV
jgi:hypothetical protein